MAVIKVERGTTSRNIIPVLEFNPQESMLLLMLIRARLAVIEAGGMQRRVFNQPSAGLSERRILGTIELDLIEYEAMLTSSSPHPRYATGEYIHYEQCES